MRVLRMMEAILTGALWFVLASDARACSCAPWSVPEKALEQADAVFLGTIVDFEVLEKTPEIVELDKGREGRFYRGGRRATVRVWTVWKGPQQKELVVLTGEGGGDCGFDFIVGREYLVYANQRSSGAYGANICSRTRDVWASGRSTAEEDLRVLGEGTAIAP